MRRFEIIESIRDKKGKGNRTVLFVSIAVFLFFISVPFVSTQAADVDNCQFLFGDTCCDNLASSFVPATGGPYVNNATKSTWGYCGVGYASFDSYIEVLNYITCPPGHALYAGYQEGTKHIIFYSGAYIGTPVVPIDWNIYVETGGGENLYFTTVNAYADCNDGTPTPVQLETRQVWYCFIPKNWCSVCTNGQTRSCYPGPSGTENVGECKAGTQTCVNGQWGACQGEVTPQTEICDGKDNNCNNSTDEGLSTDTDGDGHYTKGSCKTPHDDCDDNDPTVYPGATELCDGKDNNCDGEVDEGLSTDADGDGHYTKDSCKTPNDDCNDSDNTIYPGATELCDEKDNDCDGEIDEGCCEDKDGDGHYRKCDTCPQGDDPADDDPTVYPGAPELCDGKDNDCDGQTDEGLSTDADGDGHYTCDSCDPPNDDPDDSDPTVYPGADDVADNQDNDGDGEEDENSGGGGGCNSTDTGSSTSLSTGHYHHAQDIFNVITLIYDSRRKSEGTLGKGWAHSYDTKIEIDIDKSLELTEYGSAVNFRLSGNTYIAEPRSGIQAEIIINPDNTYTLTKKDGTVYQFDASGRLLSITDRNSNQTTLTYTGNLLTSVTDPYGRVTLFTYDASNRIIQITDPANRNTTLGYNADGLLSTVTNPDGSKWTYTYDASGNMVSKTDPAGATTSNTYDSSGRMIKATDSEGNTKTLSYDQTNKKTTVTNWNAGIWTYKYDNYLDVSTEITDPDGNIKQKVYDSSKNLISETDESGNTTTYTYDENGNMLTSTDPANNVTAYMYNSFGQTTSVTTPDGNTTTYSYDTKGNLLSVTDPSGATSTFTYDTQGHVLTSTDPDAKTTSYMYDNYGNVSFITTSDGNSYSFIYDITGNLLSQTDSDGNTTTYEYDIMGNLIKVTDPSGTSSQFTYDSMGRRTSSTDANGNVTRYEYNSKGQITKVIDALGNVTTYEYGNASCSSCSSSPDKLTSITDANGNKTTYEYDLLGRLIKETDPEGKVISYEYDSIGNLISKTDATGVTITYTYDSLSRLTDIEYPDTTLNVSYAYDSTGKILTMTDQSGTTEYSYDDSNRLIEEIRTIDGLSYTTSYTYTSGGKLLSITYPSGRVINYNYNESGRIISVSETKGDVTSYIITDITYNTNGSIASITYSNSITTSKTYNSNGSLSSLVIGDLKSLSYTRDNVGNITSITDALDSTKNKTYVYDVLYRLTQAVGQWGTLQYSYDPVGNRMAETSNDGLTNYTYSANKLTSSSGVKSYTFSYDANGNTITENQKQYIYNQNQRLIKAVEGTKVLGEYLYNANGQRVKKIANNRTTYFIYDQAGNLIEEADERGQVISDYIYLGSVPIARVDEWWKEMDLPDVPTEVVVTPGDTQLTVSWNANAEPVDGYKVYYGTESGNYTDSVGVGNTTSYTITGLTNGTSYYITVTAYADIKATYYYHTDHLVTPIMMTDKNGSMVWEGEFLPFGEEYSIAGSVTNNLRFLGQYFDKETGLHYNYFRDYKPEIGRYLQRDPIGFKGGINPYNYTNNPVNWTDPFGLYDCTYDVSDHTMTCTPNNSGNPTFSSSDYVSGNNLDPNCCDCQDNPNRDDVAFHGPIPDGDYTIEAQRTNSSRRDLTPAPTNEMHGRSGFQTHGCSDRDTCSQGCIAATTNTTRDEFNRLMSLEEGNNTLLVEP